MRRDDLRVPKYEPYRDASALIKQYTRPVSDEELLGLIEALEIRDGYATTLLDAIGINAIYKWLAEQPMPFDRWKAARSVLGSDESLWELFFDFLSDDNDRDRQVLDAIGRTAALQHWLTDPCSNCNGKGEQVVMFGDTPINTVTCPACDGRGWVPKKGVEIEAFATDFIIPLDWLGDDDAT